MVLSHRPHPGVNEEVLHLFGYDVNRLEFVRLKQGIGIRLGFVRELVDNGRDDVFSLSRLLKLPRAKEVRPQDLWRIFLPIEVVCYAVRDCRLARSRLADQPEDRWTVE